MWSVNLNSVFLSLFLHLFLLEFVYAYAWTADIFVSCVHGLQCLKGRRKEKLKEILHVDDILKQSQKERF